MLDLVEMEVRELLNKYKFDGDNATVVRGAALPALNGDAKWEKSIGELLDALDTKIPDPVRDIDKPFLMAIEDVFSIKGRGTVGTGRVERGIVKMGEEVEIVGFRDTRKTVVTGVEMFRKLLDQGQAGDNIGVLLRGIEKDDDRARSDPEQAGLGDAAQEVRGRGVRPEEGGGRSSHAVLHELPPAVLHADDGRDGHVRAAGGDQDGHAGRQHQDDDRADHAGRLSRSRCASRSARAAAPSAPASSPRSSSRSDGRRMSRRRNAGRLSPARSAKRETTGRRAKPEQQGAVELKKYCPTCKRHTVHKETK